MGAEDWLPFDWTPWGDGPEDPAARCMFCGNWFEWRQRPEGWRLTTPTGRVHHCRARNAATADEFPDVSTG